MLPAFRITAMLEPEAWSRCNRPPRWRPLSFSLLIFHRRRPERQLARAEKAGRLFDGCGDGFCTALLSPDDTDAILKTELY
jgi:hypothetical protein